jgi:hypothetical protein
MSLQLLSPAGPPITPTWASYLIKRNSLGRESILSQSNRGSDEIGLYLLVNQPNAWKTFGANLSKTRSNYMWTTVYGGLSTAI